MTPPEASGPREWDAADYDVLSLPMVRRGEAVMDRLELAGDETVVDAGCGTGRVTELLLRRLPRGRVVALDGSVAMLDVARERLAADPRTSFVRADLEAPLPVERPVDAIMSTSTFHWVRDHDALFGHLAAALRPGGRLSAECGGAGNISSVVAALGAAGRSDSPWTFATPDETRARLTAAGFSVADAWLTSDPIALQPRDLAPYLRTVVLGSHIAGMGTADADALVARVAAALPEPVVDYVRLHISARL